MQTWLKKCLVLYTREGWSHYGGCPNFQAYTLVPPFKAMTLKLGEALGETLGRRPSPKLQV